MNVFSSLDEAAGNPDIRELTLGFFDGLHLGHRQVITGSRTGRDLKQTAMLSFRTHPQSVLFRDQPITLITGLPHKQKILSDWGIRSMVLLPFDRNIAQKSPETFLKELQNGFPHLESLRVGENFRFGHQRRGNPSLLHQWGQERKIHIHIQPSLHDGDSPISSSRIRSLLQKRDISQASRLLGRNYSLWGKVVEGEKIGMQLGFPTANLSTEDGLLLPAGVYWGWANLKEAERYPAAINIGIRPTVSSAGKSSVEAHLLDYTGNLYGQTLELEIQGFLREEVKFGSRSGLVEQLAKDALQTRALAA